MNISFLEFISYGFVQRAFISGIFVGVLCSILGLFLVLRKLSLIGDGLAHVSFGAIAMGLFFGIYPIYFAIPIVILSSIFIVKLTQKAKIYGDTAIGIVSSVGLAGGVLLASISNGFNVSLLSYLFGNILAISASETYLSIALSLIVLVAVYLLYYELFAVTFNEEQANVTGIKSDRINLFLVILTAITVVLSIRVVGIMLVSSFFILPAVTALQISKGFKSAIFVSALVAILSVITGICASFYLDLPAGASIVIVNFILFLLSFLWRKSM